MNKILISQFYLIIFLSFPVLANYPFIEPIDYNLPVCEFKNNKVITRSKCIGEINEYLGFKDNTFFGEIENRKPNGNGHLYSDFFEYWGEFKNGDVHGYGKMSIPSKNYTYHGDFKKNTRTGFGVDLDEFNGKFIGEYRNDQRDGEGRYIDMEKLTISNLKWKKNQSVGEIENSKFSEYSSGIGLDFNHSNHLSLIPQKKIDERLEGVNDTQKALFKRPFVERIFFVESNAPNLHKIGKTYERLIIEYDLISEEEAETIFSSFENQRFYQDKYRYVGFDHSEQYENTLSILIFIEVNERYYTISYISPYFNKEGKEKADINFNFFFNSLKFDVL